MTDTTQAPLIPTPAGPVLNLTGEPDMGWPRKARLEIRQDQDCENPLESGDGRWKLYDFTRHSGQTPADVGFEDTANGWRPSIGLRRKFAVGLAFFLDVYDHSGRVWSLSGEGYDDGWDTSHKAGVLIWEHPPGDIGAKTKDARKEDARRELEEYNKWLSGDCYGYILTDPDTGQDIDSCWGYIGLDYLRETVREALDGRTLVDEDGEPIDVEDVEPRYG